MTDYTKLALLADSAPICPEFGNDSQEAQAYRDFVKEVIALFRNDVGMARALLSEIKKLESNNSNLVFRNKVLRERHDLPLDRIPAHDAIVSLQYERDKLKAENKALRLFTGACYPVSREIDERGYRWSEAYLDQALASVGAAMGKDVRP